MFVNPREMEDPWGALFPPATQGSLPAARSKGDYRWPTNLWTR
jgi:hypothetical protein